MPGFQVNWCTNSDTLLENHWNGGESCVARAQCFGSTGFKFQTFPLSHHTARSTITVDVAGVWTLPSPYTTSLIINLILGWKTACTEDKLVRHVYKKVNRYGNKSR